MLAIWPQSHNDVVQKLLRKARKGTRVILTPGNHDDMLRGYLDHEFGRILVVGDAIHEMADGTPVTCHPRRSQFDRVMYWRGHPG